MNAALIETTTDAKGRTCYKVAGMVTTYDQQEALDLTATGVLDPLKCPLTRRTVDAPTPIQQNPKLFDGPAPVCNGSGNKFAWER